MGQPSILSQLENIADAVRDEFQTDRRVMSFSEYLEAFAENPVAMSRDASTYVRDAFDHFGTEEREQPWGASIRRYKLFDLPWLAEADAAKERLIGQEEVQQELFRILNNFVREGRPNRMPLLHGPNGSAKSTVARCLMLALEHYSQLPQGALYRFHWVFPSRNSARGAIGFGDKPHSGARDSFAALPDSEVDARLFDELRDHPLLLLPMAERRALLDKVWLDAGLESGKNHWLWRGTLSHKNRTVFDALLAAAKGELSEVLRHVQVERYFISRRYRVGAVTLGPELNVDAGERQVTADRSLSALPSSLQAVALFEAHGELVEAAGGVLEFSDLLKRPLDAFKYLQITVETGEFALPSQNVHTNCVMLASANELELTAFKKHPEFESYRGRLELIKMPYLLNWHQEQAIYDAQITPQLREPVAPHATSIAAMFAVLTRLRAPNLELFEREERDLIRSLSAVEKMRLYADGQAPGRLDGEKSALLRSLAKRLMQDGVGRAEYEGGVGASPREMRTLLLDAAQHPRLFGLSPFAVLEELDELCKRQNEYAWLAQDPTEGGYHDQAAFREFLEAELLERVEGDFRVASGLVDEKKYGELFARYIQHVGCWTRGEKLRNLLTGSFEEPDEALMTEVEALIGLPDDAKTLREGWMNQIGAWAIEHPGQPVDTDVVFQAPIEQIRDSVFGQRRDALKQQCADIVTLLLEEGTTLDAQARKAATETVGRLVESYGYQQRSVADAAARLLRSGFAED